MPTVHRAQGFDFRIYPNDHEPPHVHVYGHGGEARIQMLPPNSARVLWSRRLSTAALRRATGEVAANCQALLAAWERVQVAGGRR